MLRFSPVIDNGVSIVPAVNTRRFANNNQYNNGYGIFDSSDANVTVISRELWGSLKFNINSAQTSNTIQFSRQNSIALHLDPSSAYGQITLNPLSTFGKQIVLGNYLDKDYDHATPTNPTLFFHSATDPDTDNTEWLGLTHNVTNPVISWGKGLLSFQGPSGVGLFGAWASKAVNTVYQAEADGILVVCPDAVTVRGQIIAAYSDSSNPPTTLRARCGNGSDQGSGSTLTIPVRKGDYYKYTWSASDAGSATGYWLPIGAA